MKWNGWLIAAAICAGVALYLGAVNQPGYVVDANTSSGVATVDCGTLTNPRFPRDGKGPCTGALADRQTIVIIWGVAAVVLGGIGFSKVTSNAKE